MQVFSRKRVEYGFSGPGTQMTILALFIMLLAFFILMNSISNVKVDTAKEVNRSLRAALGGTTDIFTNGGTSWIAGPLQRNGTGTSLQEIAGSFQTEMPGLQATFIRRSGIMRMVIAANTFNDLLGLTGGRTINPQLQQMIDVIAHPELTQNQIYDLQLLVMYPPDILQRDDRSGLVTQKYLTMWARALQRAGVPADQLTIGVGEGHAGFVTLTILPREKAKETVVAPSAGAVDINNPDAAAAPKMDDVP